MQYDKLFREVFKYHPPDNTATGSNPVTVADLYKIMTKEFEPEPDDNGSPAKAE